MNNDLREQWMRAAIDVARAGIALGQSPFGSAIVQQGELVVAAHNSVVVGPDATAHAEIVAIRAACQKLGTHDLSSCEIYATCEPCPMCASAIHWAKIPRLYFGAAIDDAARAGFSEIPIAAASILTQGSPRVLIESGVMREECLLLFDEWLARPDRVPY